MPDLLPNWSGSFSDYIVNPAVYSILAIKSYCSTAVLLSEMQMRPGRRGGSN